MSYQFKNFVFEGGGVKGIAYLGALEVFEEEGILENIERIGGTSAGAINAILLSLGFSTSEMKEVLWKLNFTNFMDDSWGVVRDLTRLKDDFGWYKGDYFRQWIGELIEAKTGSSESTFADIEAMRQSQGFKSLYLIGTNLSTSMSQVFSYETTPNEIVADAARVSMSIPLFFAAKRLENNDLYVDGGVLNNYPVKLFDKTTFVDDSHSIEPEYYKSLNTKVKALGGARTGSFVYNKETLGFRLDTREEIAMFRDQADPVRNNITDFFDYSWALIRTILENQQNSHLHSDDWARTVYIDTIGVETTDFELSNERKEELIASGKKSALHYLSWFNGSEPKPNSL